MKNIHVLPTNKPTRIFTVESEVRLAGYPATTFKTGKHIYITNSEEIKEGQNYIGDGFSGKNKFKWHKSQVELYPNIKKDIIILTTDQDLIKDGVQAIDDEFLEWFVKNPSCEFIEIKQEKAVGYAGDRMRVFYGKYKIIIPKEEPKQFEDEFEFQSRIINKVWDEDEQETLTNDIDSHSWGFENFEVIKTEEDAKIFLETMENIPEPNDKLKKAFKDFNKQETLEEVAEKYSSIAFSGRQDLYDGFIAGAKWQAERMYSEEEVRAFAYNAFCLGQLDNPTENKFNGWFEQFKKK